MQAKTAFVVRSLFVLLISVSCARAWEFEKVEPARVGLSAEKLGKITELMQQNVDNRAMAGAVAVVARNGRIAYFQAVGRADIETDRPMRTDTILRMASMTKPITSVAALILYDEGKIALDDPVSKFIPEFANPKVLRPGKKPGQDEAASREITIKDLLTHTSGLTYQWDPHLGPLYKEAGITHGVISDDSTLGEKMKRLGKIPLLHNPGEKWTYGLSVDVLGRVVEVVSGKTLAQFMKERIFEPLEMNDTFFFVPDDKIDRLATAYAPKENGGLQPLWDQVVTEGPFSYCANHPYAGKQRYYSGGGGLCSTMQDYLSFCQMLLNGGQLGGRRILKEETVELMTRDHVGDLRPGAGFGLGVQVVRQPPEMAGSYGWGGFWYTTFFVDPDKKLIAICGGQLHPTGRATLNQKFTPLVYESVNLN